MEKTCTKCGETKPITDFPKRPNYHKTTVEYRKSACRVCTNKKTREWQIKNKERFSKYQREYRKRV